MVGVYQDKGLLKAHDRGPTAMRFQQTGTRTGATPSAPGLRRTPGS